MKTYPNFKKYKLLKVFHLKNQAILNSGYSIFTVYKTQSEENHVKCLRSLTEKPTQFTVHANNKASANNKFGSGVIHLRRVYYPSVRYRLSCRVYVRLVCLLDHEEAV